MADDIVMKIEGIKGESKIKDMKEYIDIVSVGFGIANSGTMSSGGGGGAGKATFDDVHIVKKVDKASAALAKACASGKHISEAKLHFRKQGEGQKEYLTVTLNDLIVSHWNFGHHDHPEHLTLNFSKITYDYKEQDNKGSTTGTTSFGYDVKTMNIT